MYLDVKNDIFKLVFNNIEKKLKNMTWVFGLVGKGFIECSKLSWDQ